MRLNLADLLLDVHGLSEERHLPFRYYSAAPVGPDRDNVALIGCWTCRVVFYEAPDARGDFSNVVTEHFGLGPAKQSKEKAL